MSYKSKWMHIFENENDFMKQYGNGWLYKEPWVSAIKGQTSVIDKPAAFNFKPEEKPFNVGDIVLTKNGEIYNCPYTDYVASAWTGYDVNGVICIPTNFLPDGNARMIALHDVNSSGQTAATHSAPMIWGNSTATNLPYYSAATIFNNVTLTWTSSTIVTSYIDVPYGMLSEQQWTSPSSKNHVDYNDHWCRFDFGKYQSHVTGIASPYTIDGMFNDKWTETVSGGNVLSDFDGYNKTLVIASLGSSFRAANACYSYEASDEFGPGKWHLPSAAEFIAAHARSAHIVEALRKLGLSGLFYTDVDDADVGAAYYWTSTECNAGKAFAFRVWEDDDECGEEICTLSKSETQVDGDYGDVEAGPFVRPFAVVSRRKTSPIVDLR